MLYSTTSSSSYNHLATSRHNSEKGLYNCTENTVCTEHSTYSLYSHHVTRTEWASTNPIHLPQNLKDMGLFLFTFMRWSLRNRRQGSGPRSRHLTAHYSRRRTSLSPRHRTQGSAGTWGEAGTRPGTRASGSWHGTRARPVLSSVVTTVTCAGSRGPGVWLALRLIIISCPGDRHLLQHHDSGPGGQTMNGGRTAHS